MNAPLAARLLVGPLAAVAFFLSWGTGSGPLAAIDFSGYRLVAFTGALDVLVDGAAPTALLTALRLAILAVVIAAVWHSLLAPVFRWHPLYVITGWYLVATGLALVILTVARGNLTHPPAGVLLMATAAALFALVELSARQSWFSFRQSNSIEAQGSAC